MHRKVHQEEVIGMEPHPRRDRGGTEEGHHLQAKIDTAGGHHLQDKTDMAGRHHREITDMADHRRLGREEADTLMIGRGATVV